MALGTPWIVLAGVLIGIAAAAGHLCLLYRALGQATDPSLPEKGARLAIGLPLRLLAVSPALYLVARGGLWASLGFVFGFLVARTGACVLIARQWAAPDSPAKQG